MNINRRTLICGSAAAATAGVSLLAGAPSAVASTNDPYFPSYGDSRYRVDHYSVGNTCLLSSNRLAHRLYGSTIMSSYANVDLTYIDVDFALNVISAEIDGVKARVTKLSWRKVRISGFSVKAGRKFKAKISYNDSPVARLQGADGILSVANQLSFAGQPNGATYWHPSNDRLTNRATYSVSLSVNRGYDAIGPGVRKAGPINFTDGAGRAMTNFVYELTEPVVAYLPAIHYGKFIESRTTWRGSNGQSVPLLYAAAGTPLAQSVRTHTERSMEYLTKLYGPYPFNHGGAMVMDGSWYFWGEENAGLPTYRRDKSVDKYAGALVAHENAHMWFGNSVTASSWKDVLLFHEGLATLIEFDYARKYGLVSPYRAAPSSLVSDPRAAGMFTTSVYNSSVGVIQELRRTIDGSIYQEQAPRFTAMLRTIGQNYKWKNISRAQFKAEAQRAAGKSLDSFWRKYSL